MYILNTTYAVDRNRSHEFLVWLQQEMIPSVSVNNFVEGTSLTTVVHVEQEDEEIDSDSYCLQNAFLNMECLNEWAESVYMPAISKMLKHFGTSVQYFNTLLDEILLTPPN